MDIKEYFEDCMFDSMGRFCSPKTQLRYHEKRNTEAFYILSKNLDMGISVSETVYRIINKIKGRVLCDCGIAVPYGGFNNGYKITCQSDKCLRKAYGKNPHIPGIEERKMHSERMRVSNPMFNPETVKKVQKTQKDNNGGKLPMHSEEAKINSQRSRYDFYGTFSPNSKLFKPKDYKLPSGKVTQVQGYENMALDILFESYKEVEIVVCGRSHNFKYNYNGNKIYYPDIYIPSKDLYIEVKSDYTLNVDFNKNIAKRDSVLEHGHNFEFWILSKKGELIIQ